MGTNRLYGVDLECDEKGCQCGITITGSETKEGLLERVDKRGWEIYGDEALCYVHSNNELGLDNDEEENNE